MSGSRRVFLLPTSGRIREIGVAQGENRKSRRPRSVVPPGAAPDPLLQGRAVKVIIARVAGPQGRAACSRGIGVARIVIEMSDPKELDALMNAADYEAYLQKAGGGH